MIKKENNIKMMIDVISRMGTEITNKISVIHQKTIE